MDEGCKLFVGGIPPPRASTEQVTELFAEVGGCYPIEVFILPPKGTNQETRCAFVRIPSEAVTQACEALNGLEFDGFAMPLAVRLADKQSKPPPTGGQYVPPPSHTPSKVAPPTSALYGGESSSPAIMKARAKAAGRWLEAAEWEEQEHSMAGETWDAKIERLRKALIAAAIEEHFYEATSLEEALNQLDPQAAALANAEAAAAASTPRRGGLVAPVFAHASIAPVGSRAKIPPPPQVAPPPHLQPVRPQPPPVAPPLATQPASEGSYLGTILSYRHEKQFGFIQCPELGVDAFVSSYQINGFNVGDQVLFDITYNPQGKPQAQNLRAPESEGFAAVESPTKRMRYP